MRRVIAVVVLAAACAACLPLPGKFAGRGQKVRIAGDSQVYLTADRLTDAVAAAGYSASTSSGVGTVSGELRYVTWPSRPDISVTVIGVNDMRFRVATAVIEANVAAYWSRFGAACNVAVEVPVTSPYALNVLAPPYNAWLKRHATVTVPWASMVTAHPEYVIPDGVHQTEKGMAAFRAAIVAGVRQCP